VRGLGYVEVLRQAEFGLELRILFDQAFLLTFFSHALATRG
jgi:hypothetical protein